MIPLVTIGLAVVAAVVVVRIAGYLRRRFARGPTLGESPTYGQPPPSGATPPHGQSPPHGDPLGRPGTVNSFPGADRQRLDFSAFSPEAAAAGSTVLTRVIAARPAALEQAKARARAALEALGHGAVRESRAVGTTDIEGPALLTVRFEIVGDSAILLSEQTQYQPVPNVIPKDFAVSFDFLLSIGPEAGPIVQCEIEIFVGPLLVSVLQLVIVVTEDLADSQINSVAADPFQRVFVSYSRSDTEVASIIGAACRALGVEFLIDSEVLRTGDQWSEALLDRIDEADVFQLLWSAQSAASSEVEREWRHALERRATGAKPARFIRPFYWSHPMPAVPAALASTHFGYVPSLAPRAHG